MGINLFIWVVLLFGFWYLSGLYLVIMGAGFLSEGTVFFYLLSACLAVAGIVWFWKNKVTYWIYNYRYDKRVKRATEWYENEAKGTEILHDETLLRLYEDHKAEQTHWIIIVLAAIAGFFNKACPRITWK